MRVDATAHAHAKQANEQTTKQTNKQMKKERNGRKKERKTRMEKVFIYKKRW